MNRTSEFQVAAKTDGQIVQTAFHRTDSQKVGQCLGRMLMSAVTGVDDRDGRVLTGYHGRTFLWMSHRTDVCIAGNHADGVGYAFALWRQSWNLRKKIPGHFHPDSALQLHDSVVFGCSVHRNKVASFFAVAGVCIFFGVSFNIIGRIHHFVQFSQRKNQEDFIKCLIKTSFVLYFSFFYSKYLEHHIISAGYFQAG